MEYPRFFRGDAVRRHGGSEIGRVCGIIDNESDKYVVEFGHGSFVVSGKILTPHIFKSFEEEVKIERGRRAPSDD